MLGEVFSGSAAARLGDLDGGVDLFLDSVALTLTILPAFCDAGLCQNLSLDVDRQAYIRYLRISDARNNLLREEPTRRSICFSSLPCIRICHVFVVGIHGSAFANNLRS